MFLESARLLPSPNYVGLAPEQGPRALPMQYTFSAAGNVDDNIVMEEMQKLIGFVQTVYIDNPTQYNGALTIKGSTQVIRFKSYTQGFYTALSPDQTYFNLALGGAGTIGLIWMNVPVDSIVWATQ